MIHRLSSIASKSTGAYLAFRIAFVNNYKNVSLL